MEDVDLHHAREHLEELVARARRGEDVRISDPKVGTVKLTPVDCEGDTAQLPKRQLGFLEGIIPPPPDDFFDPMSESELKDW